MIATTAAVCLALNVFYESRSEPLEGQIAVAYVTHHRAKENPNNYCKVVFAKNQFSWTKENKDGTINPNSKEWKQAVKVSQTFLWYYDRTDKATYFHRKGLKPKWSLDFKKVATIGKHVFYKESNG